MKSFADNGKDEWKNFKAGSGSSMVSRDKWDYRRPIKEAG